MKEKKEKTISSIIWLIAIAGTVFFFAGGSITQNILFGVILLLMFVSYIGVFFGMINEIKTKWRHLNSLKEEYSEFHDRYMAYVRRVKEEDEDPSPDNYNSRKSPRFFNGYIHEEVRPLLAEHAHLKNHSRIWQGRVNDDVLDFNSVLVWNLYSWRELGHRAKLLGHDLEKMTAMKAKHKRWKREMCRHMSVPNV